MICYSLCGRRSPSVEVIFPVLGALIGKVHDLAAGSRGEWNYNRGCGVGEEMHRAAREQKIRAAGVVAPEMEHTARAAATARGIRRGARAAKPLLLSRSSFAVSAQSPPQTSGTTARNKHNQETFAIIGTPAVTDRCAKKVKLFLGEF